MSNGQTLEAEVVRVTRCAGSRSPWTSVSLVPSLVRISWRLDTLVDHLETDQEQLTPCSLNSLTRAVYTAQGQFNAPLLRPIVTRIEQANLRLADYTERTFMAAQSDFRIVVSPEIPRRGPASAVDEGVDTDQVFRSA
jgi:hypothetical protein